MSIGQTTENSERWKALHDVRWNYTNQYLFECTRRQSRINRVAKAASTKSFYLLFVRFFAKFLCVKGQRSDSELSTYKQKLLQPD